ncbi:endonuclease/exonuclease/phosphatase family metal-dependent hydrolase [Kribbella voronezhensis]|uniref:Endonuclease/exonuclease/phosphatase family metal-dependent hydrolase n=1 Tax=Kribbella voronezhensis TaxID=2512212 RepID=A0A4R7THE5_9ACTN|nr:endonuclease/exonuclease/phosphatase family protein [Kribbella voronezhensis]TDU91705.1 endonuclease/exonuclease/phosphatase family metal-dependent hydrolase [Kribbella voronezhensis]
MGQRPEYGSRVSVASLNTRGTPLLGSRLAERYRAIGEYFEAGDVDVVSFQEVLTYWHLRQLTAGLPSFRYAGYRPSALGPAGGLVTMSRRRLVGTVYQRFPRLPGRSAAALPRRSRLTAPWKGSLMVRLAEPSLRVINTHLLANFDADWTEQSRYYEVHRHQLAALTSIVESIDGPLVVTGDFNISRDSSLFAEFVEKSRLADAFEDCPPTFHPEYLGPGQRAHCIDFLLFSRNSLRAEKAHLIFTDKVPMKNGAGFASDHLGLTATVGTRES